MQIPPSVNPPTWLQSLPMGFGWRIRSPNGRFLSFYFMGAPLLFLHTLSRFIVVGMSAQGRQTAAACKFNSPPFSSVSRIFCRGKRIFKKNQTAATTTAAVHQSTDGIREILASWPRHKKTSQSRSCGILMTYQLTTAGKQSRHRFHAPDPSEMKFPTLNNPFKRHSMLQVIAFMRRL